MVAPPGAAAVAVPRSREGRRRLQRRLEELPVGTPLVLTDRRPLARARCLRIARASGLRLEREYVALPTPRRAAYLVEDTAASLRYFCDAVLTVPPTASPAARAAELALRLMDRVPTTRRLLPLLAGRVVVARA